MKFAIWQHCHQWITQILGSLLGPRLGGWQQKLRDQRLGVKLGMLILLSTALPVLGVTYGMVEIAENNLMRDLQVKLRQNSEQFEEALAIQRDAHLARATGLSQSVHFSAIPLNAPRTAHQTYQFQDLLAKAKHRDRDFAPSFYIITDAQGRTVAQDISSLVEGGQSAPPLPVIGGTPWQASYTPVSAELGIDLKPIKIVQAALRRGRSFASLEILDQEILKTLKLDRQAFMPLRSQPIHDLSPEQRPVPEQTFPIDGGRFGMAMMAVVPIQQQGNIQGTVIVGTLMNRNYALVDHLKRKGQISAATLFAYDVRISTTVPYQINYSRAIATRGAKLPMETVLNQRKSFEGSAVIVDQKYHTVYRPIYDHQLDIDPTHAQPIGSYLVAINEQEMSQTLGQLIWMGGAVGGVIVVSLGILAFPLANRLTQPIRRLTHFAELVGQDQVIPFPVELQHRNDEIGVLAQTLNAMLLRLDETLAIAHVSEQELRRQTVELQATLTTLQKTQTHLIQSEKMSGLGQLVAGVAHEINNPVNFIYGNLRYANEYTEQLMQIIQLYQQYSRTDHPAIQTAIEGCDFDFIATDLPNLFQSMKGGADRIKQIVQSLRVFSRLDESESKVVNLHDGLDSTLVLLTHRLRLNSDRSEIMICQNYGELPRVECYAGEMNQVFINILSNAIDAINERVIQKGTLENPCIEIQTRSLDNDLIQITIHDNGIGMTDEVRSQIFNPFFTTKPVGSGIGMGLANTYQIIVEHHRGDITVCSALGEGTSFTITLPIRLQK